MRSSPLPLLVCLLFTTPGFGQTANLDRDISRLLQQDHIPSVSIAQVKDGKIAFVRAYGQQDAGTPATPRTLYNIASLTKPITAQVALRLLSQGTISLDEPMAKVWTDPDIATDERRNLLTPRIALSHRTGFPNWRSDTNNVLTFKFTPGTQYSYSGEGFEYLARFMEHKTGQPLDVSARKLVFDPLGMHDTAFTRQPWFAGRIAVPADAQGKWLTPRFAEHPVSADLVYTTASDYARLLLAVIENTGLTPPIARERDTIQFDLKPEMCPKLPTGLCPDALGSGLSWQVLRYKDTVALMHTGHDPGVYTFACVFPGQRSAIVLLTNGDNGRLLIPTILAALGAPAQFTATMTAAFSK